MKKSMFCMTSLILFLGLLCNGCAVTCTNVNEELTSQGWIGKFLGYPDQVLQDEYARRRGLPQTAATTVPSEQTIPYIVPEVQTAPPPPPPPPG